MVKELLPPRPVGQRKACGVRIPASPCRSGRFEEPINLVYFTLTKTKCVSSVWRDSLVHSFNHSRMVFLVAGLRGYCHQPLVVFLAT
jgi:hypothetical protein